MEDIVFWIAIILGVSPASILSPLLFKTFFFFETEIINFASYADDHTLYVYPDTMKLC